MADPLSIKLLDGAIGWAVGRLGDALGKRLGDLLSKNAARNELVEIGSKAIEAAVYVAPELGSDLRSEAYLHNVLAPALLAVMQDPTGGLSANELAHGYIERFVAPYLRGRDLEDTLSRIFRLEPERLRAAFSALVETMRSGLYKSAHWREPISAVALEEIREGVLGLQQKFTAYVSPPVDLDRAREDARIGSEGLRSWSQTIAGLHLDRPELDTLRERIRSHPAATTLVTGPAGSGKSALLAELTVALERDGMTVFAIKADLLPDTLRNLTSLGHELGMEGEIVGEIEALSRAGPLVLVIDQLDAVSEVMDRTSRRMQILLQLANRWRRDGGLDVAPVHVVVSSRPFEASHDARFQSLRAEEVSLGLPQWDAVASLLSELGLDPQAVPELLRDTLRRPFLLKLFVEIAKRGEPTASLVEGELLNAWLRTAPLGDKNDRKEVTELLKVLATEMTATETLWRPADKFDQDHPEAVRRAEACELVIRRGALLGFAHQSWLDDFQSRAFTTGRALAEHAWSAQDGLFGRATVLRGLERLRAFEPGAYAEALDLLLGDVRTRRHLKHLTTDLVAIQAQPHPREIGWVQRHLREDEVLARRAISKVVDQWEGWHASLAPLIPSLKVAHPYVAVALSIAEAQRDSQAGDHLIETVWSHTENDDQALEIAWRAKLWTSVMRARVEKVLRRTQLAERWVAMLASELADADRPTDAADLLSIFLQHHEFSESRRQELYGLEKVWQRAPAAYVSAVLPWFLKLAAVEPPERPLVRKLYPRSYRLPYGWQEDDQSGNVLAGFQKAVNLIALEHPEQFRDLVVCRLSGIECDEVQAVIAEGFAAAGQALAHEAIDWLLADPRRLHVGTAHVADEDNVYGLIQGYSTGLLLAATAAHVSAGELVRLVAAIERWDEYCPRAYEGTTASDRRDMRRWSEEHRARLLDLLPASALSARRRRQVTEFLSSDRRPMRARRSAGREMAGFVRSRMSAGQMAKATDDQVFGMLETLPDHGAADRTARRRFMEGGPGELAHAFGNFAKSHPERAMELARARFASGRQELAAGAMVREISQLEDLDAGRLLELIRLLIGRGFDSADWRRDAGWALENIARDRHGLDDQDLATLECWLDTDPTSIASQTTRRHAREEGNRERNKPKEPQPAQGKLFGRGLGGLMILPQDNNVFLSAIGTGLTLREPPAHEAWLATLERHVERPEDPAIWREIFRRHAWSLHHSDKRRVEILLRRVFGSFPEALNWEASHAVWKNRALFPADLLQEILISWLPQNGGDGMQLAGEFAMALSLIEPDDAGMVAFAELLSRREEEEAVLGTMFGAAAVWREAEEQPRRAAHGVLMKLAVSAQGRIAEAVSSALDRSRTLPADRLTRELLTAARDNLTLLKACLNHRFVDALQDLLLHPGFEDLVLEIAQRSADLMLSDRSGHHHGFLDKDFVAIAVALQRASGPRRGQAMDLYERLLDAGVYGADQAARASLQR